MTQNYKYKTLISAFLLALYSFIATPVKLWHQDCYEQNITKNKSLADAKTITETIQSVEAGQSIETSCQICSHYYSIYNNTDTIHLNISIFFNNPRQGFNALDILSKPYFNSINKGPPSLG